MTTNFTPRLFREYMSDLPTKSDLTVEQRIHIAASFDSEKIKMIRELMEEEADNFSRFVVKEGYVKQVELNIGWTMPSKVAYKLYQQFKQTK